MSSTLIAYHTIKSELTNTLYLNYLFPSMTLWNHIKDARHTILSNKLRSGLSSLGIIIGISSVVIMLAIGAGTENQIKNEMGSVSANSASIKPSNDDAITTAKKISMDDNLVHYLETTFVELSGSIATSTSEGGLSINYGTENSPININGVSEGYFELSQDKILYGGDFEAQQFENARNVIILSNESINTLFNKKNPIGRQVKIKGKTFEVIGVMDRTPMDGMLGNVLVGYIPQPSFDKSIGYRPQYDDITLYFPEDQDNETRRQIVYSALLKYVGVDNTNEANFEVISFATFIEAIQSTLKIFSYFLAVIGGISLLVGGIGVMNIMIVSVTERTREIGIRKAVGALNKDIILQFLTESIVITFMGGAIAIIISYLVVGLINYIIRMGGPESQLSGLIPVIEPGVLLLAFSLTAATGVLFGIMPARKAAKLKPIDALRFE